MKRSYFILLFVFMLIVSCSVDKNISSEIQMPDLLLDQGKNDVNSSIVIQVDPFFNGPVKNGENIYLNIQNKSKGYVEFPSNYALQLFVYDDNEWESVDPGVIFKGGNTILVPESEQSLGNGLCEAIFPIHLKIENQEKPLPLLVSVSGKMKDNTKAPGVTVSAYVQLKLIP